MNRVSRDIKNLFQNVGVHNMEKLPDTPAEKKEFSKLFQEFNQYLAAAKVQGFHWESELYIFDEGLETEYVEKSDLDESTFLILAGRYKELSSDSENTGENEDVPYDLVSHLLQIDTGKIDADYMNHSFTKYLKMKIQNSGDPQKNQMLEQTLNQLHKTFANLTQEEQKLASIILRDVDEGKLIPEGGKTMRDYITEYQVQSHDDQISAVVAAFGIDEATLRKLTALGLNKNNIDEFGRFTA